MYFSSDTPNQILRCLFDIGTFEPVKAVDYNEANIAMKKIALLHPNADLYTPQYPNRPNSYPNDKDDSMISKWLTFAQTLTDEEKNFQELEKALATSVYLIGSKFTLADAATYIATFPHAKKTGLKIFPNVRRWFDLIQNHCHSRSGLDIIAFDSSILLVKIGVGRGGGSSSSGVVKDKISGGEMPSEGKESEPAVSGADKKAKKSDSSAATAAAAAAATPALIVEKEEALDPSKLEIRVGLVIKCWNHPESEKLLCEEIELGEGSVRQIASGLRPHYTAEQFQGRKVLVLCNLKERAIAGFKSNGMVLCACSEDHSVVKLLQPPADAALGERVMFPDYSSEPATPAQMAKKKVLEKLAPGLKTDGAGRAAWGDALFTLSSGVVSADTLLPNAPIS